MTKIGAAGKRALEDMARGRRMVRDGRGWRIGARRYADKVRADLHRADLIEAAGEAYRISGPGMAFVQRRASPDLPNRLPGRTADQARTRAAAVQGAKLVNRAENPLGWLHARGKITGRQFEAGEKLRGDFLKAGDGPRISMSWDAAPPERGKRAAPDGLLPGERVSAAKRRSDGALNAAGPGLSDMLRRTVCHGEGMETAEKALGWPARSGRVVLGLALDRVADFYRL